MDPIRRNVLATGAAATAMAAATRVFAQQAGPGAATNSFYEKGNIRVRYTETGSGLPLLVVPGGGLNSRISGWPTAVFNAMEEFKNDFRCIAMDQRNANYRVRPDFVYSVSRDFVRACRTPMLVLPDDAMAHPYQTSVDIASLAPNAEVTVYPWKDPPELKARTINRMRTFLKAHQPATTAR